MIKHAKRALARTAELCAALLLANGFWLALGRAGALLLVLRHAVALFKEWLGLPGGPMA